MPDDAIEELRDELNEYKRQLDALKEDLKAVIELTSCVRNARQTANQSGNPSFNQDLVQRMKKFADKYEQPS